MPGQRQSPALPPRTTSSTRESPRLSPCPDQLTRPIGQPLAGLADDAPTRELRQTCIDVLCAYLRLPYTAEPEPHRRRGRHPLPTDNSEARHSYLALREVRHTIIRLIRDHLRLPLQHHHSWQGHDLDFTGVTFDGRDLSGAVFSGGTVNFRGAVLSGDRVFFSKAVFSGGRVILFEAVFAGSTVSFSEAAFSGSTVNFTGATFSGGVVDFNRVVFSGGTVDFSGANGAAPLGLTPTAGSPLPDGFILAASWEPTDP
jgi:hypothetical protein